MGQIPCLPWCEEELNKETVTIRDPLIKINRLGFLTINSQPRVCGVPSTDPTFGWGTPGGCVVAAAFPSCTHRWSGVGNSAVLTSTDVRRLM
jgi:methylenetetrahydrofolate reductase (NADPH)